MKTTTLYALLGLTLLLIFALGACGGDSDSGDSNSPPDTGGSSSIEPASASDPDPVDPVAGDTQPGTGGGSSIEPMFESEPEPITSDIMPATIRSFAAEPAAGPAPLAVQFTWDVGFVHDLESGELALPNPDSKCALYLTPPSTDEPKPVYVGECSEAKYAHTLGEVGPYEVVLVYHAEDAREATSLDSIVGEQMVNGVDPEWLNNRALKRRLLVEVTEPVAAQPDVAQEPEASAPVWKLVETDTNPYDLSVEADIFLENASYAGSFKECKVQAGSISYWYVASYSQGGTAPAEYLANVVWTYAFDAPPASAEVGEVITLTHSLSVAGEHKVGGGHSPSGRASYSTDFQNPPVLEVSSVAVHDDRFPIILTETVKISFPTSGNWFGIEARVLDSNIPDIACDIAWWYERNE